MGYGALQSNVHEVTSLLAVRFERRDLQAYHSVNTSIPVYESEVGGFSTNG